MTPALAILDEARWHALHEVLERAYVAATPGRWYGEWGRVIVAMNAWRTASNAHARLQAEFWVILEGEGA